MYLVNNYVFSNDLIAFSVTGKIIIYIKYNNFRIWRRRTEKFSEMLKSGVHRQIYATIAGKNTICLKEFNKVNTIIREYEFIR